MPSSLWCAFATYMELHYDEAMVISVMPDTKDCPLPEALETIGERWSFLILRSAFLGITHFEDFQSELGIARNILSNRLTRMVEKGIFSRKVMPCDKRRVQYLLTAKGRGLGPVMIGLRQWAERWERGRACSPALVDRRDGMPVRPIAILAHDGRRLSLAEVTWAELPNTDPEKRMECSAAEPHEA
jgi:DNA-binding HxlR family transcriptional regulator